jgi:hypothetical protein
MAYRAAWMCGVGALLFSATALEVHAQGAIGDFDYTVTVPPGGVLADGSPADYPVEPGDLLLSLIQSPTNMFAALMNEEAEVH